MGEGAVLVVGYLFFSIVLKGVDCLFRVLGRGYGWMVCGYVVE